MARLFRHPQSLFALGAVVATWACSSSPSGPSPVLNGVWGGDHIALAVADSGTHLEFDCAHGDIPGMLMVSARAEFDVSGTFVREHGGPVRMGEVPDSHPAAYVGSVTAMTMLLTVRLTDTNEVIGTFTLSRGSPGRVVTCLLPLVPFGFVQCFPTRCELFGAGLDGFFAEVRTEFAHKSSVPTRMQYLRTTSARPEADDRGPLASNPAYKLGVNYIVYGMTH